MSYPITGRDEGIPDLLAERRHGQIDAEHASLDEEKLLRAFEHPEDLAAVAYAEGVAGACLTLRILVIGEERNAV